MPSETTKQTANVGIVTSSSLQKNTKNAVSDDTLQSLHSIFGETLVRATELLENCKVLLYHLQDFSRKLIKLTGRKEEHILFCDINFCNNCDSFKNGVLEGKMIACEHVLAVKLAEIRGDVKNIAVTNSQMKDMLNDLMSCN